MKRLGTRDLYCCVRDGTVASPLEEPRTSVMNDGECQQYSTWKSIVLEDMLSPTEIILEHIFTVEGHTPKHLLGLTPARLTFA
jgi:hypothetical protein